MWYKYHIILHHHFNEDVIETLFHLKLKKKTFKRQYKKNINNLKGENRNE